jgi:hypothetical protein
MWLGISLSCLRLGATATILLVLPVVLRTSVVVKSVVWITGPPAPPPVLVQAYTEARVYTSSKGSPRASTAGDTNPGKCNAWKYIEDKFKLPYITESARPV